MDRSRSYRRMLLARLFSQLGLMAPDESGSVPASGGQVAVERASGNAGGGNSGVVSTDGTPVPAPGPAERSALAAAWAHDGHREHAAVAGFGRFALDLLAVGAPACLVADAHRAALDEVRHARLCFGLASAYAGEAIVPGPFDFGRGVAVETDLAVLAERTFLEGCVRDTLAAVHAAEQLAIVEDPAAREAIATIADGEAHHAELAFRTLAWLIEAGGTRVWLALRDAADRVTAPSSDAPSHPDLAPHGRLDPAASREAMERALEDVVLPCLRAMLDASGFPDRASDVGPTPARISAAA